MKTTRRQPKKPLPLPAKAVQEMRQMAIDRRQNEDVPSPRGAAEFNFQSEPEGTCRSNDDVEVSVVTYSFADMSIIL